MALDHIFETPFQIHFSFEPLLNRMKNAIKNGNDVSGIYQEILKKVEERPELYGEISIEYLNENKDFIRYLVSELFPESLSDNEIKALSIPFVNFIFNPTRRLEKILSDAGEGFDLRFRGFYADQLYVMSCCIILSSYYKIPVRYEFPLVYDIPNKEGYTNFYRILTNADFLEIHPTDQSIMLSEDEIQELLDQYENLDLWKEKFPPKSWDLKGFGLISMYDATTEIAISNLKGILIQTKENPSEIKQKLTEIFKSIYRISDLEIGFTSINLKDHQFEYSPINNAIDSKVLSGISYFQRERPETDEGFIRLLNDKKYFSISDIDVYFKENSDCYVVSNLIKQNIKSAIFIPIHNDQKLLGIIEITSKQKLLNSINATKMDAVLPFLSDSISMLYANLENHISALIQQEYTTIHPSVYWKFYDEVRRHINFGSNEIIKNLPYRSISFEQLTPLYGQTDIKNSSKKRNEAILKDLKTQLETLLSLIHSLKTKSEVNDLVSLIQTKYKELEVGLKAYTETDFQNFLVKHVHPRLDGLKFENIHNNKKITAYFQTIESNGLIFSEHRKNFEKNLSLINRELSHLLDKRLESQQKHFPFYSERFRTDGVEHNLYIGASIAPWLTYDAVYLKNLRLAQFRILIESEILLQNLRNQNNFDLEVTSLILAYSTKIGIKFRMDEKKFDVDGGYNARYEVIKKRIDKSLLKNSKERLVQPGKISIVYSNDKEKIEYLHYISILQQEGHLKSEIELVDVENLQGIVGLKAIRVQVNPSQTEFQYPFYIPKNIS